MEKQTVQQQKTHGKTSEDNVNKDKTQTNTTELLRRKTGYDQHVSPDSCIMFLD